MHKLWLQYTYTRYYIHISIYGQLVRAHIHWDWAEAQVLRRGFPTDGVLRQAVGGCLRCRFQERIPQHEAVLVALTGRLPGLDIGVVCSMMRFARCLPVIRYTAAVLVTHCGSSSILPVSFLVLDSHLLPIEEWCGTVGRQSQCHALLCVPHVLFTSSKDSPLSTAGL